MHCLQFEGKRLVQTMKPSRIVFMFVMGILLACAGAYLSAGKWQIESSVHAAESAKAYLGRWDLTLKAPGREYPSWLELRQDAGQLQAEMVGRWGNARPLPKVELSNGHLTFVSPKEEEERNDDMVFEGKLVGQTLAGTTTGQDGTPWSWTGQRAPSLKRSGTPKWGKPI